MSRRVEQVAEEIQRILGEVLQFDLKDPRVGFATVMGVDVSADLAVAKVRISVMNPQEREETMAALERAKGFMRRRVAQELRHMRSVPELRLILDTSLDYSIHIDELLRKVREDEQQRALEAPPREEPPSEG
jgi:ribosome-binding factor A